MLSGMAQRRESAGGPLVRDAHAELFWRDLPGSLLQWRALHAIDRFSVVAAGTRLSWDRESGLTVPAATLAALKRRGLVSGLRGGDEYQLTRQGMLALHWLSARDL